MKKNMIVILALLCCACSACAADPMSFQSYFTGKTEATTIAPDTDYIPVIQGSLVRKIHPKTLFNSWQTPSFSSSNFISNIGTWTVSAGNVTAYTYLLQGNTMTVSWYILNTSVSGSPSNLRILIPENKRSKRYISSTCTAVDNGTDSSCVSLLTASSPYISLYRSPTGSPLWSNSTSATSVFGQMTFEVQ